MTRFTLALALLTGLTLTACKNTPAGACRNYVNASAQCSNALGGGSGIPLLTADVYCLAYSLPGIPKDADVVENFNCLADAYNNADCSSAEAFEETFDNVCDDPPEGDDDTDA